MRFQTLTRDPWHATLLFTLLCAPWPAATASGANRDDSQPFRWTSWVWDPGQPSLFDDVPATELQQIVDELGREEPEIRRAAAVRLLNLPGSSLSFVTAHAADTGTAPEVAAALKRAMPTLQARARIAGRARSAADRQLQDALAAYDAHGKRDPKWDADAREAIALALKPVPLRSATETQEAITAMLRRVVEAGCDDPLLAYLLGHAEWQLPSTRRRELAVRCLQAVRALARSEYPPVWKCTAATDYALDTGELQASTISTIISQTLPDVLAADPDWEAALGHAERAYDALRRDPSSRDPRAAAFERVKAIYVRARSPQDPGLLTLEGHHFVDYAWDVRGRGFSHTVSNPQWVEYEKRLDLAKAALTRAWELDVHNGRACREMIRVSMGLGDDAACDAWYSRAVQADPDDELAGAARLTALRPRWGGSYERMIAFGKAAFATGNFRGRVASELATAHRLIAAEAEDGRAYLGSPAAWPDVLAYYEGYQKLYPGSTWHASKLALLACETGHWDDARRTMNVIGDKPNLDVFGSRAVYDYYRRKATAAGTMQPSTTPVQ